MATREEILASLPELRGAASGESRIDPTLRPYLGLGLQRAEQLFFGPGPQFFQGQTYVSPSEQTLAALQQQEALARGSQPALQEAQRAFLAGLGPSAAAPLFQQLYGAGATQAGADVYGRAAAGQMGISPAQFQQLYGQAAPGAPTAVQRAAAGQMGLSDAQIQQLYGRAAPGAPTALQQAAAGHMGVSPFQFQQLYAQAGAGVPSLYGQVARGASTIPTNFLSGLISSAQNVPGTNVFADIAGGRARPSTQRLEQLYEQAGAGVPSLYGQVARGGVPSTAGLSQLAAQARPGTPTALSQAAAGQRGIGTSFLSGLTQQAGMMPEAGLYSQVAGGGFQNLALPATSQTAAGQYLTGSPYQQALIEQSVRPITRQLSEVTLPGIQSAFSAAGRYGSGAQQRAIGEAVERASRAAGDVATQIGAGTYAQERGFQEAARQQLAGLSQQDLANRLAAAGELQTGRQSTIAQQAGLFGQQAGLEQQNIATQLGAAQSAEAIRQAQLAQAGGLQGQVLSAEQQNLATRLAAAGAEEQTRQAQISQQAGLASQISGLSQQDIANRMAAAGQLGATSQSALAQQAGLFGQQAGLQQQNLATQLQAQQLAEATRQAQLAQQTGIAGQLAGLSAQDIQTRLGAAQAAEQIRQSQLAQQAGLAGQSLGVAGQNIQTQLGAAQSAEAMRQAQLAQQAGLAGQIAGLRGQDISTQLAGAGGLQSAQQAAFARQMQAAGGLGAAQEAQLARGLTGAQLAPQIFAQQFLPSQQLGQIGAAREQIAGLPLQEEMARFQFGQQAPYQQLQGFLSSVYGTPMGGSQMQQIPQAQTNRLGSTLGGALLGSQVGGMFGGFGGFTGGQIGAGIGGLAGLLL